MSKFPRLDYIGPVVVGIVTDCDCPKIEQESWMGAQPPHEAHDIIAPIDQNEIPETMSIDEWNRYCRLFAAAPDLLAACKAALDDIFDVRENEGLSTEEDEVPAIKTLRAAIAKAEAE